ncbi:MAG: TolB family protein [Chitinophagaceae bacterium]
MNHRHFLETKHLLCLFFLMLGVFPQTASAQKNLGLFDGHLDLGKVARRGSATFDPQTQEYTLSGAGDNMWFTHDQGQFLYKHLSGNFILQASIRFIGKGVEPHRKIGWMVRSSLDSGSAQVSAVVHGVGLTSLQFRRTAGTNTEEMQFVLTSPDFIQLERKDGRYIMSVARRGDTLVSKELTGVDLGDRVVAGLFICSHNSAVTERAVFSNVRIVIPAPENFVPYKDYIGSYLEIMNISTGLRKIVHQYSGSFQAPNWTPDGKYLIYNQEGLLYRFNLANHHSTLIPTGFATNNNNDHVLSFNGKMLGISDMRKQDGNASNVYVVPVSGGRPRRISPEGPSYMHGWSPNGKMVVYTGERDGNFDIYQKALKGGQEIRLTTAMGLDDGPEYTPDGQYIYFNSVRSGRMQIWRMKPDGTDQEQITFDHFNNWFPHISPNGKWVVFISFPLTVKPDDHPFYKHVYLRLMPAGGGPIKVIAYLYGGQGTINVPSWSPDSKKIAFVSNTVIAP